MMMILLALAAATGPVPLKPLTSLVSNADKLAVVQRVGVQGTVAFKVTIETSGRVSDCSVEHSSGFRALDEETCRIVRSRARFSPAKDEQGRPAAGVLYGEISWDPETEGDLRP